MVREYYLCFHIVWKGGKAQGRLPTILFKGLTSSRIHSDVCLPVSRFWFYEKGHHCLSNAMYDPEHGEILEGGRECP